GSSARCPRVSASGCDRRAPARARPTKSVCAPLRDELKDSGGARARARETAPASAAVPVAREGGPADRVAAADRAVAEGRAARAVVLADPSAQAAVWAARITRAAFPASQAVARPAAGARVLVLAPAAPTGAPFAFLPAPAAASSPAKSRSRS